MRSTVYEECQCMRSTVYEECQCMRSTVYEECQCMRSTVYEECQCASCGLFVEVGRNLRSQLWGRRRGEDCHKYTTHNNLQQCITCITCNT